MDLGPKSAQERGSNFNMWVAPYFPTDTGALCHSYGPHAQAQGPSLADQPAECERPVLAELPQERVPGADVTGDRPTCQAAASAVRSESINGEHSPNHHVSSNREQTPQGEVRHQCAHRRRSGSRSHHSEVVSERTTQSATVSRTIRASIAGRVSPGHDSSIRSALVPCCNSNIEAPNQTEIRA